jgi:hypothetical protein
MRLLALAALIALAACAPEQPPRVWYRPDGTPVSYAQMHTALLACGAQLAPAPAAVPPLPPPAQEGWAHVYDQLGDSPGFGRISDAEIAACFHSYGYRSEAIEATGSSLPPASQ